MLARATMRDAVTTAAITGMPSNWMRQSLDAAGFTPDMLETRARIDFSNLHGDSKAWKTIWGAGHAVGTTRAVQSVAEIVEDLVREHAAL